MLELRHLVHGRKQLQARTHQDLDCPQKVGNRIKDKIVLGFPIHASYRLRQLAFQLLGFY